MPKKIFDILPPEEKKNQGTQKPRPWPEKKEEAEKKEKEEVGVVLMDEVLKLKEEQRHFPTRKSFKKKQFILRTGILFLFLLLFISGLGYVFFSKTKIEIWPQMEAFSLKETIVVDPSLTEADFESKIFPGKVFENKKSASKEFSSSGTMIKEKRARGVIRVFNAHSVSPQPLLVNTRFVSADGKLFRSEKRVVIPGGRYEGGKLVPGHLDIMVKAAEPGAEYNIGPSVFSIPGFAGTAKYTTFYAESYEPMSGGFRGEVPQVTQEDLDSARNTLVGQLKKESRA